MSTRLRQRGVTLIELIMFILIIAIALTGLTKLLTLNASGSADPVLRKQALMIAESLMEEVEQAGFTYCDPQSSNAQSAANSAACTVPEVFGPEAGNTRPYDNVNDYASAANTPTTSFNNGAGKLVDLNGTLMNNSSNYSATVKIVPETLGGIAAAGSSADVNVLRITVTVTYNGGSDSVRLDGYRTRYAPVPN